MQPVRTGFLDVAKSIMTSKCIHKAPLLVGFLAKCTNICFFSLKVQIFDRAARVRAIVSLHLFLSALVKTPRFSTYRKSDFRNLF